MATRVNTQSQTLHERLIRALVEKYESEGYSVQADHISHSNGRPPEVGGHVPDIAAYKNGLLEIVAEAETCDSLSDSHTEGQWRAFSASPLEFHVIVPKSCLAEAERQAGVWSVNIDKWWWLVV